MTDVPVVITLRLQFLEGEIKSLSEEIKNCEAERDALKLAVRVITSKQVESAPTAAATVTTTSPNAKAKHRADFPKILSALRRIGPENRRSLAVALGMKPDEVSIRLTEMKKLKLVVHDEREGLWSAP